jgi:hypothetical protein
MGVLLNFLHAHRVEDEMKIENERPVFNEDRAIYVGNGRMWTSAPTQRAEARGQKKDYERYVYQ